MPQFIRLHTPKIAALLICANALLLLFISAGQWKPLSQWSWADILGEGGSGILIFIWLCLILKSRPAGRITNLLALGMGLMCLAWWVDVLDEVIHLADTIQWDHWLESGPMTIGLLMLTYGLYHWHHEQLAISSQRRKQEQIFREHRHFDHVTPLSDAENLRRHIKRYLAEQESHPVSLVVVDINQFDVINQRYGHAEGDRVLQAISQLLLLNLRSQDLLCRLAGDRFIALLPKTGESQAKTIAWELEQAIAAFAYRCQHHGERLHLSACSAVTMAGNESCNQLLERLQLALATAKNPLSLRA